VGGVHNHLAFIGIQVGLWVHPMKKT
jgi:hypothetical protein